MFLHSIAARTTIGDAVGETTRARRRRTTGQGTNWLDFVLGWPRGREATGRPGSDARRVPSERLSGVPRTAATANAPHDA
jgi:hypothetical protein